MSGNFHRRDKDSAFNSCSVDLETKLIAKTFALSDVDEINAGAFMMDGPDGFPVLRIVFEIYQNL